MDRRPEILHEGLDFGEGPRWHDGRLWLSDFYRHHVLSLGADGDPRVEVTLDDRSQVDVQLDEDFQVVGANADVEDPADAD